MQGEGPPLLLHLGAGCDSQLWRVAGYLEPLSSSYRCILFDHRGHGESDRPWGAEAHHIDRHDVLALLDQLEIEKSAFWGYSAGIDVGLKLANDHSVRIRALGAAAASAVSTGTVLPRDPHPKMRRQTEMVRHKMAGRSGHFSNFSWPHGPVRPMLDG